MPTYSHMQFGTELLHSGVLVRNDATKTMLKERRRGSIIKSILILIFQLFILPTFIGQYMRAKALNSMMLVFPFFGLPCYQQNQGYTICQGHSALVPAQRLSTVGVSRPRQPTLQEDNARLSLYERRG